jgi:hypothetical protein
MIEDVYGTISGIITMTCFAILPAVGLIAIDKTGIIPSKLTHTALRRIVDRYMANSCFGWDASRWQQSRDKEVHVANHANAHDGNSIGTCINDCHHDSGFTSASGIDVASANDVEMITKSP